MKLVNGSRRASCQRDLTVGVPAERRTERMQALRKAFELFEGNDAAAEIRKLKAQDAGF